MLPFLQSYHSPKDENVGPTGRWQEVKVDIDIVIDPTHHSSSSSPHQELSLSLSGEERQSKSSEEVVTVRKCPYPFHVQNSSLWDDAGEAELICNIKRFITFLKKREDEEEMKVREEEVEGDLELLCNILMQTRQKPTKNVELRNMEEQFEDFYTPIAFGRFGWMDFGFDRFQGNGDVLLRFLIVLSQNP